MELKNVRNAFPYVVLTFKEDGQEIIKSIKVSMILRRKKSGELFKKYRTVLRLEAIYQILLMARDAVRDFAFMKYGDKWREHVELGKYWKSEPTLDEAKLIHSAVKMMEENNG